MAPASVYCIQYPVSGIQYTDIDDIMVLSFCQYLDQIIYKMSPSMRNYGDKSTATINTALSNNLGGENV